MAMGDLSAPPERISLPIDGNARLRGWRANVGAPIALDLATEWSGPAGALLVLSWNVWIGRGRLLEVVEGLRAGAWALAGDEPLPLVVLLQEAYRSDATVPESSNGFHPREIMSRTRPRADIAELATHLGWNLRYVPSMRNAAERSDRGNAILSPLPLEDTTAIELPMVLQRRVALAATVRLGGRRLRLVSGHLDPRGPPGYKWLGAAGRAVQTAHLLAALETDDPLILGADLNLGRGRAERSWRLLTEAGLRFGVPPGSPRWRHTYHALPRLVLDYILIRDRTGAVRRARIERLDQDPADRGPVVFGSDHHPLLGRIDLNPE
jgi:endonuclease/exonuclease/phosphatase family metal-dependent hydrolase